MEKIYLLNNQVFKTVHDIIKKEDLIKKNEYETILNVWKQSLVKLACDESDLYKINKYVFWLEPTSYGLEPKDITSITTVKRVIDENYKGEETSWIDKVFFKEVDSESQETLLAELSECIIANKNGMCNINTILNKFTITRK